MNLRSGRLLAIYAAITNQVVDGKVSPVVNAAAKAFVDSEKDAAMRAIHERSYARLNFHLERLTALLNYHRELAPEELPRITREWLRLKLLDPPLPGNRKRKSASP